MTLTRKVLTGTLIGAGLLAGYRYYLNMKKTQAELEIIPDARLHKVNWDGIIIRIDVLLKNPTKGSFAIKFPFVKLTYKETAIGSSEVVDKEIKIPAFGQAKIDTLLVTIPIMNIFTVSSSILKAIQNNEMVKITAKMMTTINLGWTKIPFEESHEVVLKK